MAYNRAPMIKHLRDNFPTLLLYFALFTAVLALSRLLFEQLFPHLLWLGRPSLALPLALIVTGGVAWGWRRMGWEAGYALPLLINWGYLWRYDVDLVLGGLLFWGGVWGTAVLLLHSRLEAKTWRWLAPLAVVTALLPLYLLTMPSTVGRNDTFEFQVVAYQLGIAHPTGYPLYLLLSKLFTLLPFGSVALRVNLGTMTFGLIALALLAHLGWRLWGNGLLALFPPLLLGLSPIFWSQAIEAEVYTLHAVFVAGVLLIIVVVGSSESTNDPIDPSTGKAWHAMPLRNMDDGLRKTAVLLGLGLTNHLTTLFLAPGAGIALLLAHAKRPFLTLRRLAVAFLLFLLPLTLYAYLPLRWAATNPDRMGLSRFVDWVMGGRFQGALQWSAWLNDPTRYDIVWRLFREAWGWPHLGLAVVGLIFLLALQWRVALPLLITWLGFTFYNLNYYVPDLAVFLIPAQIVVAVFWLAGITAVYQLIIRWLPENVVATLLITLLLAVQLPITRQTWAQVDRSAADGRSRWGAAVLAQPLADEAAILADSDKFPPLYYWQQVDGRRPDFDIMVLPDEAAYRAELERRMAEGQPVYLARFLPGLEGIYHLRSEGPLTEVSNAPLIALPEGVLETAVSFSNLTLIGVQTEEEASVEAGKTAVTLYWQASQPTDRPQYVYVRLADGEPDVATGQHPAANSYPTVAWKEDEIVPDFHLLTPPLGAAGETAVEVAVGPPFTAATDLTWQTVTTVNLPPIQPPNQQIVRAQIGSSTLTGMIAPAQVRPNSDVQVAAAGQIAQPLTFALRPIESLVTPDWVLPPSLFREQPSNSVVSETLDSMGATGTYWVMGSVEGKTAVCGWLWLPRVACPLAQVQVRGVPLPDGAINFDNQIALLAAETEATILQPGGQLNFTLRWQALGNISSDYTIFAQLLDDNDQIVGQIDAWPVQGTFPTSQWTPGETVIDPHAMQLSADLPPGNYRLIVGFYLLADLRRLSVLDEAGAPLDDKAIPFVFEQP